MRRSSSQAKRPLVERSYSNYEQSYTLPDDVVKDQISAKVEDGILTVTMPKTEVKAGVQLSAILTWRRYFPS